MLAFSSFLLLYAELVIAESCQWSLQDPFSSRLPIVSAQVGSFSLSAFSCLHWYQSSPATFLPAQLSSAPSEILCHRHRKKELSIASCKNHIWLSTPIWETVARNRLSTDFWDTSLLTFLRLQNWPLRPAVSFPPLHLLLVRSLFF